MSPSPRDYMGRLDMSARGVGYAVERGAAIVLENDSVLLP